MEQDIPYFEAVTTRVNNVLNSLVRFTYIVQYKHASNSRFHTILTTGNSCETEPSGSLAPNPNTGKSLSLQQQSHS